VKQEKQPMNRGAARSSLAVLALAGAVSALVAVATSGGTRLVEPRATREARLGISIIDEHFSAEWKRLGIVSAEPADELTVLRRAALALHGTVPSLEEIRAFEADNRPDRLHHRIRAMLAEPRFADYFAERLARAWIGVSGEPFLVFRRDRFTRWLAQQLRDNRPYDDLARAVLATDGLWTSEPAANFVTAAFANDELDHNGLAARTVRGFLGQRIDCAQCHDHPFANWKQSEFQALAAFFGHSAISFQGVVDQPQLFGRALGFRIDDPATGGERLVEPAVPFLPEVLPSGGSRRERLATWITHPQNDRFPRATVNRIWGLLFGRPFVEPVDDLPDPGDPSTVLLDQLGAAFRDADYDLRWLIESLLLSQPFRLASSLPEADEATFRKAEAAWAVFPMTRLRPEQVIGAMIQAGRLRTIDHNSHLLARTIRFFREQDFVREYGDAGEAELEQRAGTVAQALLRLNGQFTREMFEANPFTSAGRLAFLAADDERLLEVGFLITLTRRPTSDERDHFLPLLQGTTGDARGAAIEDLLWSLVNSTPFSWNH
jgi:hypothetical protein